jgi:hypothetical protein
VDRRFAPVRLTKRGVELGLVLDGSGSLEQELVAVDQK